MECPSQHIPYFPEMFRKLLLTPLHRALYASPKPLPPFSLALFVLLPSLFLLLSIAPFVLLTSLFRSSSSLLLYLFIAPYI